MRRLASIAVVLTAVVFSCYGPHYGRCTVACTMDGVNPCPEGFTCSGKACISNSEAATGSDLCPEQIDAGSGSQGTDADVDAAGLCHWSFVPTNYDLAALPPATSNNDSGTIATDGLPLEAFQGTTYAILHVDSFTIASGSNVAVTGTHPLIIVSDTDATISGTLEWSMQNVADTQCAATGGGAGQSGGGGGGGGYGTSGGSGGASPPTSGGNSGSLFGLASVSPLRFGCPGGLGGSGANSVPGGAGGTPGGAFEVSACGTLAVSGQVLALGGGGGGGNASSSAGGGGGGGASGGSILLEAHALQLTGMVCALGGGGGGGGLGSGGAANGAPGSVSVGCTTASGGMSGGSGIGGSGGGDGFHGDNGGNGSASNAGGGGGGGGNGRICLHGGSANGATVHPASNCP